MSNDEAIHREFVFVRQQAERSRNNKQSNLFKALKIMIMENEFSYFYLLSFNKAKNSEKHHDEIT